MLLLNDIRVTALLLLDQCPLFCGDMVTWTRVLVLKDRNRQLADDTTVSFARRDCCLETVTMALTVRRQRGGMGFC